MLAFCFCVEACTSGSSLLVEFFFYFSFNLQKNRFSSFSVDVYNLQERMKS